MGGASSRPFAIALKVSSAGVFAGAALFLLHRCSAQAKLDGSSASSARDQSAAVNGGKVIDASVAGTNCKSPEAIAAEEAARALEAAAEEKRRCWAQVLIKAAGAGELEKVRLLLGEAEAEAAAGTANLIELLDMKAEYTTSYVNITAVFAAALEGQIETLKLLLKAGASTDLKCEKASVWDGAFTLTERDTALVAAARYGQKASVEVLLGGGADPNVPCDSEYLDGAVEWGDDDDGTETLIYSALDAANMGRHSEIAQIIQSHGGVKLTKPSKKGASKRFISQGSRMGA